MGRTSPASNNIQHRIQGAKMSGFDKVVNSYEEAMAGLEDGMTIIKPVDMAPSKREGIRHAFTAESLRCIGGDEVDRLRQLLNSGMPPTIDTPISSALLRLVNAVGSRKTPSWGKATSCRSR